MTIAGLLFVIVNLYLVGGLIVAAGVFSLQLIRVNVPMSLWLFFRWAGWIGVATLVALIAGDLL